MTASKVVAGLDLPAADHHRDLDALALHAPEPILQLGALGRAGRVGADRLVDGIRRPENARRGHARDCRVGSMRVTPHAYEVEGWGVGELWEADGRLVVAHEAPTKRRAPGSPAPTTTPRGTPGVPTKTLSTNPLQESNGFVRGTAPENPRLLPWQPRRLRRRAARPGRVRRRSRPRWPRCCGSVPWGEVVTYGELAALAGYPRAGRAVGTFCAHNRYSRLIPCHRVVAVERDRLVRLARPRVQAAAAAARGPCRSLTISATSSLRSRRVVAVAGSPSSRRCSTPPAASTSAVAARWRCISISRARQWRGAPSRSCASSASTPRSARTAAVRSTARRGTSSTSRGTSGPWRRLSRPGVLTARHAPLERPPRRVVGRCCCRGAYLRGAFLGAGSLSGPRSPHLELRTRVAGGGAVSAGRSRPRTESRSPSSTAGLTRSRTRRASTRSRPCWRPPAPATRPSRFEERAVLAATRADANRLANADHANLVRTSRAAQEQLEAVRALERSGALEQLPGRLREIGHLRLRHPSLSLRELATKCDPPATKASVHRRLRKLRELAE